VFIAGGIGVTPFRSMITYLLDTHQPRPIVMFYANKTAHDIVYKDVFDRAQRELGIKTIYTITDKDKLPPAWGARVGYLSPQLIKDEVPDYLNCMFYISGPPAMVDSFKAALRQIHVKSSQIKTDLFAGLA
jgi:ferredoxin-NADP reductase